MERNRHSGGAKVIMRQTIREVNCEVCKVKISSKSNYRKYCKDCAKIIARGKRNTWKEKNPKKNKVQHKLFNEIRRKRLVHPSKLLCQDCNKQASEYHHPDYNKPFFVIPLCHSCHIKIHSNKSKEKLIC